MKRFIIFLLSALFVLSSVSYAKEGDNGYEGGISSGQSMVDSKSSEEYEYQEPVFITGQSLVMKGKVTIKRKLSKDTETITYTYDIADTKQNSLKRTISYLSKISVKDNGQTIKETTISGKPTETIIIAGKTYVLDSYSLTKSSISDPKPAVGYYAGNIDGRKIYKLKDSANVLITVAEKGQFYGYSQNWSNAETQIIDYTITNESTINDKPYTWSGTANVKLSSVLTTDFKYVKNYPEIISFDGGYLQSQNIKSTLTYYTSMPEFDKDGLPTDRIKRKRGTLKLETFPSTKRLMIKNIYGIAGHWAEENINKLYSLEIYDENPQLFLPNQFMTRAEFAKAMSKALNVVDGTLTTTKKGQKTNIVSLYPDVDTGDPYFKYIQTLGTKKIMSGYDDGYFYPKEPITRVEAVDAFIKALGLEGLSKEEYPVTAFEDNDSIPTEYLKTVYAAYKIGLAKGDNGYFNPGQNLTKAESAAFIDRLLDYMRIDMSKSYSDKILGF